MGHDHKPKTKLRVERFIRGITLRDLEQATGRSRMYFHRLETGGPAILTSDVVEKVSAFLGCPPEKIFSGEGEEK
ncbi:MAG: hypothetical protein Kow00128_19210 [Deltaproteobacteria bacterium]